MNSVKKKLKTVPILSPSKNYVEQLKSKCRFRDICGFCMGKSCCYYVKKYFDHNFCGLCPTQASCSNIRKQDLTTLDMNLTKAILKANVQNLEQDGLKCEIFISVIQMNSEFLRKFEIKMIKKNRFLMINIPIKYLINTNDLSLKSWCDGDLHDILDYDGKILLSLNSLDSLTKRLLNNIDKTLKIFSILNPDLITGFDYDFYNTRAPFLVKFRLIECYEANFQLSKLKIPIIPFFYPIPNRFWSYQLSYLTNSQTKIIAVPHLSHPKTNDNYSKRVDRQVKRQLNHLKKLLDIDILCLNKSPLTKNSYGSYFSSHTWRNYRTKQRDLNFLSLDYFFQKEEIMDSKMKYGYKSNLFEILNMKKVKKYKKAANRLDLKRDSTKNRKLEVDL